MKTKDIYQRPESIIVEVLSEGVIATTMQMGGGELENDARSKRQFWESNEYY